MSNNDLWGEEEPFSDMPEAAQTGAAGSLAPVEHQYAPPRLPAPSPALPPAPTVQVQEPEQEEETQEEFADILSDAHLRLEQGGLYKMIMNHNLFEGVDVDPKAMHNVQQEIRNFAKERMEIMLGMRQESVPAERLEIDFPFNELEVEILKKLAHTATKGATEYADKFVPGVSRVTEDVPLKRKALNPIGVSQPKKRVPSKPLQKSAAAPVQRTRLDLTIDQIARAEGIPRELLEENVPGVGGKPIHELTASELEARNRLVVQRRQAPTKPPDALPMASIEQETMLAVQRATQMENSMNSSPLMAKLLDQVKKMPIKNP